MRILKDVLNNLGGTDDTQLKEVIQNNQVLSKAVEQSERRCQQLEKRLECKGKYETLVKNC